jgi:peptidoglycan/xylan/chitin deacetylase (PgdA/CDA1 family)
MSELPYIPRSGLRVRVRRVQARLLAREHLTVPADSAIVSFTFDDFTKSAARLAKDVLEARGWRATYFASAGYCARTTHLGRMFEPEDIGRLIDAGHEIGCHTHTHLDVSQQDIVAVEADVALNAAKLEEMGLEAKPAVFAFPYGETTPAHKRALIKRFHALRGVAPGINRGVADRAFLRAVGVHGDALRIETAIRLALELGRKGGWLIFYAHDIQEMPSPWGCDPASFRRILDAVSATGAEVLPLGQTVDRLLRVTG